MNDSAVAASRYISSAKQRRFAVGLLIVAVAPSPYPGSLIVIMAAGAYAVAVCLSDTVTNRAVVKSALLLSLAFYALFSTVWSVDYASSVKGGVQLVVVAVSVTVICRCVSLADFLKAATRAFQILLLVSVLIALVAPGIGYVSEEYETGALKGVFNHRNLMSFISLIALLTFWSARGMLRRLELVASLLAALSCLILARSSSVVVVLATTVCVWFVIAGASKLERRQRVLVLLIGLGSTVLAAIWALQSFGTVVASLGRDVTLTGRTVIWQAVVETSKERRFLGFGWDAVWRDNLPITNRIWQAIGFSVYQAHQGFLDFYVQLGVGGLGLFTLVITVGIVRAVRKNLSPTRVPEQDWPVLMLCSLLIANLTESRSLLLVGWLLTGFAFVYASREVATDRRPERTPTL